MTSLEATLLDDEVLAELSSQNLSLRPHQTTGISTILNWEKNDHGGILADEMGLGKTCQATIVMWQQLRQGKGPFLVISPLSVVDHWAAEVKRFSCGNLKTCTPIGHEPQRLPILEKLQEGVDANTVVITAYHLLSSDVEYYTAIHEFTPFTALIIDESQKAKNHETMIYNILTQFSSAWFLLMTGTPIQNNINELYSLLSLADPSTFPIEDIEDFVQRHKQLVKVDELKQILSKYMLRRTKDVACKDIPACEQVVIYHGLTALQKELYLNLMMKDHSKISAATSGQAVRMTSLLMNLRKCVAHPYLFPGVEPEPFEEGEHLVEASGKFQMLDRLLKHLKEKGHRVLIFSQFVIVLDIVQDFLAYKGYDYERIDGTVRAEERYQSINRFTRAKNEGPFVFMLSTKSGGVGLNLCEADTVIFLDSDWNPQNDIQAMARCHRIGQTKPVRVVRLVGRYSVEQYMQTKARSKLKLTGAIIGEEVDRCSGANMVDLLQAGLPHLKQTDYVNMNLSTEVLERIIGKTDENGNWMAIDQTEEKENQDKNKMELETIEDVDAIDIADVNPDDYLQYQGTTYRETTKESGADALATLLREGAQREKEKKRHLAEPKTAEQLAAEKERRSQAASKRAVAIKEKLEKKRRDAGYVSKSLLMPDEEWNIDDHSEDTKGPYYMLGDVTRPQRKSEDHSEAQIIMHVADNGGSFGTGGVFNALRAKDATIPDRYELIAEMSDLKIRDVHLLDEIAKSRVQARGSSTDVDESESDPTTQLLAILIAQNYKKRDEIRSDVLSDCFAKLSHFIKSSGKNCSVHMPRIGYGMKMSWYAVERLIRKFFAQRGIPTYIYYFARRQRRDYQMAQSSTPAPSSTDQTIPVRPKRRASSPPKRKSKHAREMEDFIVESDEESEPESSGSEDWQPDQEKDSESEPEVEDDKVDDDDIEIIDSEKAGPSNSERSMRQRNEVKLEDTKEDDDKEYLVISDSFDGLTISLIGFSEAEDRIENFKWLIINGDGYVVFNEKEKNMMESTTHVVVPEATRRDQQATRDLYAKLDKDVILVKEDWIDACLLKSAQVDITPFVI